ncbi:MAG: small ribosomal subunit Rsm22 family protein [Treponema sp.]|jgi:hypothetical protein|nr:small ribosomal subunit Rsm22 family protein [Treponema sp.]
MTELFPPLPPETKTILDGIPGLIDKVFPLPRRFRSGLPFDIAELSEAFTSDRGSRGVSYLGKPNLLSAYLRYFLPWNLYRLCRLLPGLDLPLNVLHKSNTQCNTYSNTHIEADTIADPIAITDLGSGPLTLPIALWITRPELRELNLEFRCLDQTGAVLDAGKKLFCALAGGNSKWTIRTIKGNLGTPVHGGPAQLVTAVNLFNELFQDLPHTDSAGLRRLAEKNARLLDALAGSSGSILVIEPGVPRSGEFIAALRDSLIALGRSPVSPCPHNGACPFPGGKTAEQGMYGAANNKWCHFAFETDSAPPALLALSKTAGIPKERAVLSFLLAGPHRQDSAHSPESAVMPEGVAGSGSTKIQVRIISDPFPVAQGGTGRYGCSAEGLVLVTGTRGALEEMNSGMLAEFNKPTEKEEKRDSKSGALIIRTQQV